MGAIRLFTVFPRVHLQEGKNTPTEMGPRFAFGLDLFTNDAYWCSAVHT